MRTDALDSVSLPTNGTSGTRRATPRHRGPDSGTGPRSCCGLQHHPQVGPTVGDRAVVRLTGPRGRPRPPCAAGVSGCPATPLYGRQPGGVSRRHARDMLDDALCAARNTLRGVGDAVQLDVAIDAGLLVLGGRRRGGSVARNTLSAFRMLEDV